MELTTFNKANRIYEKIEDTRTRLKKINTMLVSDKNRSSCIVTTEMNYPPYKGNIEYSLNDELVLEMLNKERDKLNKYLEELMKEVELL